MSLTSVRNAYLKGGCLFGLEKSTGLRLIRRRLNHFLVRHCSNDSSSSELGQCLDSNGDVELPEEPTNCCMSGCANCVWIQYAEQLVTVLKDDGGDRRAKEIVLAKVGDPNMRAYLELELKFLESRSDSSEGSP